MVLVRSSLFPRVAVLAENERVGEELTGDASRLVPEWLLSLLVCPVDRGELHVEGRTLVCGSCGRVYEVRDGIAVMISSDAESEQTF